MNENLTARLLADFSQLITSGEIRPGGRLLPERELARRFGVSRTSLRPLMKVLESAGIILQRVGDGSYLNADVSGIFKLPLTFLILLDGVSAFELFDARAMIEPELAARAAECASTDDLAEMRRTLTALSTDAVNADMAFHQAICRATRNRICERMFGAITATALEQGMKLTNQLASPEHTLGFHRAIYSAIHLRQPDEARLRMAEHLADAKILFLKVCLEGDLAPLDKPEHA
jgi:GntR family transcriptional repressor for pyruvate dehydrogenase complex